MGIDMLIELLQNNPLLYILQCKKYGYLRQMTA